MSVEPVSTGAHSAAYASVPLQTISMDFGKPDGRKRRTLPVKRVTLLPAPATTVMSSSSLPVGGLAVTKTEQVGQPLSAETSPRALSTLVSTTLAKVTVSDTLRTVVIRSVSP